MVQANFKTLAGTYKTYGVTEVNKMVEKFKQGKETPNEHALPVSTKNHSSINGWRTGREVERGEIQVNFKIQFSLVGIEGWASKLDPGEKQVCFRTELQQEEWAAENKTLEADIGIEYEPSPSRVRSVLKKARKFKDHGQHKTTSKTESKYENHITFD